MNKQKIKSVIKVLLAAEGEILDLPENWQEEMAEAEIDTLHTANTISEIIEQLEHKLAELK